MQFQQSETCAKEFTTDINKVYSSELTLKKTSHPRIRIKNAFFIYKTEL